MKPLASASYEERARPLRRMRVLAGGLLLLMLALFAAASLLRGQWPWLAYLRAFAEAAMVGACADWFAVVSIFRHPLGIPLPRTAIVPRHKHIIGESFGTFIAENFFAPGEISARLDRIDAAGWVTRWLAQPGHARLVAERLQALLPVLAGLLDKEPLRGFGGDVARRGIDSVAAAPLVARLLAALIAQGHHEHVLDLALERAVQFIDAHEGDIRTRVSKKSGRWMPDWVDARMTGAFLAELRAALIAARADAGHPWRDEYRNTLERVTQELAYNEAWLASGEAIKSSVLDRAAVDGYFDWLGAELANFTRTGLDTHGSMMMVWLEQAVSAAGRWLADGAEIRVLLNRWTQQLVFNAVVPNRGEIAHFITEIVERWDTRTLVDKLELQVGADLQYIRINGTLIGGLVGLGIFSVSRAMGWY